MTAASPAKISFSHFIGDWAIALWSAQEEALYLARDHAGTRTLYYEVSERQILWGTHLETFFAEGQVRDFSAAYICAFLVGQLGNISPHERPKVHLYRAFQGADRQIESLSGFRSSGPTSEYLLPMDFQSILLVINEEIEKLKRIRDIVAELAPRTRPKRLRNRLTIGAILQTTKTAEPKLIVCLREPDVNISGVYEPSSRNCRERSPHRFQPSRCSCRQRNPQWYPSAMSEEPKCPPDWKPSSGRIS